MLEIENLHKAFWVKEGVFLRSRQKIHALNGVSLSIQPNQVVGLVGESGSGKSTLARLLMLLLKPTLGKISFEGLDFNQLNRQQTQQIRKKIQMIFQNPSDSLNPRFSVEALIKEPLDIHRQQSQAERQQKVYNLMDKVEIARSWASRYPHELSGGQKQRIGIARALALSPALVVADEPVSALDVSVQGQVLNLLLDLKDEFDISYLLISHDLTVIRFMCDQILVLYLGKVVEKASKKDLYNRPQHPYTEALLNSALDIQQKKTLKPISGEIPSAIQMPTGCAFHTRCPYAEEQCRTTTPTLKPLENNPEHWAACHFRN